MLQRHNAGEVAPSSYHIVQTSKQIATVCIGYTVHLSVTFPKNYHLNMNFQPISRVAFQSPILKSHRQQMEVKIQLIRLASQGLLHIISLSKEAFLLF